MSLDFSPPAAGKNYEQIFPVSQGNKRQWRKLHERRYFQKGGWNEGKI
jgi:hypothetical protein